MVGKGIRNTASTARLLPDENAARQHWKECVNEEEKERQKSHYSIHPACDCHLYMNSLSL